MIEELISLTNDLENRQDAASPTNTPPWKLLVVDDDPEVHSVTRFVLQNLHIFGRPVCLLHAHDAHVNPVEAIYAGLHLRERNAELLVNIL